MGKAYATYFLQKMLAFLPTLFGLAFFSFVLIRLVPGDPVLVLMGDRGGNEALYREMQHKLGLDSPLPIQFVRYLGQLLQGDFGNSIQSKRPVLSEFFEHFPATLELSLCAILFGVLFGVPLGILCGIYRGKLLDTLPMSLCLVGYSMPIFWWGLILILFFSVYLGITPVSGRVSLFLTIPPITGFYLIDSFFSENPLETLKSVLSHLILPTLAVGTIPLAVMARMTRSSLLEVLNEDYIRTARAKGLQAAPIYFKHALKNALIPIITAAGLLFSTLITGAILTETIFSIPGLGKWLVTAVSQRDYPVVQGGILLIGIMVTLVNIFVDITYLWVNPYIKHKTLRLTK